METIFRLEDMLRIAYGEPFSEWKNRDFEYLFNNAMFELGNQVGVFDVGNGSDLKEEEMPDNLVYGSPVITYRDKNCTLISKNYRRKSREMELNKASIMNVKRGELRKIGFTEAFVSMMRAIRHDLWSIILENNVNFQDDYLNTTIALFTFPCGRLFGENVVSSELFSYNNFYLTITEKEKRWEMELQLDVKLVAIIY